MSTIKGPPPPIKPKPRNLPPVPAKKPELKSATPVNENDNNNNGDEFIASLRGGLRKTNASTRKIDQKTIDSVVSKPIKMSMDLSDSDSEPENEENKQDESLTNETIASPFKKGVDKKGYPLPPQRNQNDIAMTYAMNHNNFKSPLKKSVGINNGNSESNNDSLAFAEGMRSPLKNNVFPPPPARRLPPKPASKKEMKEKEPSEEVNNEKEEEGPPPPLPARKPTKPIDGESAPPKLPTRRNNVPKPAPKTSREEEIEAGIPNSDVDHEYEDEYEDERSIHVSNKHSNGQNNDKTPIKPRPTPRPRTRTNEHGERERKGSYSHGYDSSDDDYGYGRGSNRQERPSFSSASSSSSQFLNTAKSFSKDSYYAAKEKSGPLAKQAMGGLNKMREKIKNKMNNDELNDFDSDDDEDRYRSLKTKRSNEPERFERRDSRNSSLTPEPPRRPQRRNVSDDAQNLRHEADADTSFDEDRPPLPVRKTAQRSKGIPLPGLTNDEELQPPHRIKPQTPVKSKQLFEVQNIDNDNIMLRAPAPLPASRRSASNSVSSGSVPPPPPSRNKAPVAPPPRSANTVAWKEPSLNLEITSLWFTKDDNSKLPKDLQGLNYQLSHGSVGAKEFKIYAFRLEDLATLRLKLVWKKGDANPLDTLTSETSFTPPPTASAKLLKEGHEKFGEHIANWCEVKEGQTVGNGECWTLAHDALERACGKYAFVSTGYVHGALICTYTGSENIPKVTVPSTSDEIRRGDILQFKNCVFKYPQRIVSCGSPDHTAIVLDVKPGDKSSSDGKLKWVEIIQQNMNGVKKVRVSDLDFSYLSEGELKVYRPVPQEWITDLAEVVI